MATFKEEQWLLGEMAREVAIILEHNGEMRAASREAELLVFAQVSLVLLAFEHFLRALLKQEARDDLTLHPLLEMALAPRRHLLKPPAGMTATDTVTVVRDFRNSLMHGNIQQAATRAGSANVLAYLTGPFGADTKRVYDILTELYSQIDPDTGRPRD